MPSTSDKSVALPDFPANVDPAKFSTIKNGVATYLKNDVQTKALINTNVAGVNP